MILVYGVLLTLILTIGTWVFRQWARQAGPVRTQQVLWRSGFAIAAVLVAVLLLRVGATLLALLVALLPVAQRLLPTVLLLMPAFLGWYRRRLAGLRSGAAYTTQGKPQYSTVTTQFIAMTLNHHDGTMTGRVLDGLYQGSELAQLGFTELLDLYRLCQVDPQSVAVLQAYLDRHYPDWQQTAATGDAEAELDLNVAKMSLTEARAILGVSKTASREEIIQAHRRLMQKFHPDRGGTDFLASRINQAKSVLLGS